MDPLQQAIDKMNAIIADPGDNWQDKCGSALRISDVLRAYFSANHPWNDLIGKAIDDANAAILKQ